jgi:hypothetical protein
MGPCSENRPILTQSSAPPNAAFAAPPKRILQLMGHPVFHSRKARTSAAYQFKNHQAQASIHKHCNVARFGKRSEGEYFRF